MKHTTITTLLTFAILVGQAQKVDTLRFQSSRTAIRYYIDADSFRIEYVYGFSYMEPAVGRIIKDENGNIREDTEAYIKNRHYDATITIFRIRKGIGTLVGRPFPGYYVPAGCFEDNPESLVEHAKGMKKEEPKP